MGRSSFFWGQSTLLKVLWESRFACLFFHRLNAEEHWAAGQDWTRGPVPEEAAREGNGRGTGSCSKLFLTQTYYVDMTWYIYFLVLWRGPYGPFFHHENFIVVVVLWYVVVFPMSCFVKRGRKHHFTPQRYCLRLPSPQRSTHQWEAALFASQRISVCVCGVLFNHCLTFLPLKERLWWHRE